jgi:hypothetical protein
LREGRKEERKEGREGEREKRKERKDKFIPKCWILYLLLISCT